MTKNRLSGVIANGRPQDEAGATKVPKTRDRSQSSSDPVLPPLSEADQRALAELNQKQDAIGDITAGCANGSHTGAHFDGPPGIGKTHTVLSKLEEVGAPFVVHQRITAKPLFFELRKVPGAVHVIEDCEQLFAERSAQTLLRSALGGVQVNGWRERQVSYSVSGTNARVLRIYFEGAIIFTSNRALANEKPEIQAILSRIPSLSFAPGAHHIRAMMRHLARRGHVGAAGRMSPRECVEVVEYVIDLAVQREYHLDLRVLDHAYGYYLSDVAGGGRTDWRDLMKFHFQSALTRFDHTPPAAGPTRLGGRQAKFEREVAIALEIDAMPGLTEEDRLRLYEERAGAGSRATYYRRLRVGRGLVE
jgi:hypothetical protein